MADVERSSENQLRMRLIVIRSGENILNGLKMQNKVADESEVFCATGNLCNLSK
jgi:hypothetical protein